MPAQATQEISYTSSLYYRKPVAPYNPDDLVGKKGLKIYKQMMTDEQVRAAISAKQFAVLSTGYEIVPPEEEEEEVEDLEMGDAVDTEEDAAPEDDTEEDTEEEIDPLAPPVIPEPEVTKKRDDVGQEMADFAQFNLDEIEGAFDSKIIEIMTALVFGFSCGEKVLWNIDYGKWEGKIGLKMLKFREPFEFDFDTDGHGNILDDGVIQGRTLRMPRSKFVIYSSRKTFDNFYGESDLRAVHRAWYCKDTTQKFMMITAERYGEPFLIFNHEQPLNASQRADIEDFIKNLQNRTGIVLPKWVTLTLQSPDPKVGSVFLPILQYLDTQIRVGLLMPGLIGLSGEQSVGSYARSQTEFDAFLWIVSQVRKDLETVINEQIIKPLIDLNYEVKDGNYPKFQFKQLTEELKAQQLDNYLKALQAGAILATTEDEAKIRDDIGFPPPDPEVRARQKMIADASAQGLLAAGNGNGEDEDTEDSGESFFSRELKKKYHLPGEHDQCDHSPTGECSDPEWEKSEKNPKNSSRKSNLPESYADMDAWIKSRSSEYGSKNDFLSSSEYRAAYPYLQELYKAEKTKTVEAASKAMASVGAKFGDKVGYDYVTPFGIEQYTGSIVSKGGFPRVKLDEGQATMGGGKSTAWHKGWKIISDSPKKHDRQLSQYEKRVDFELLKSIYEKDGADVDKKLRALLRETFRQVQKQVEDLDRMGNMTPNAIANFKVSSSPKVIDALREHLAGAWRKARDAAVKELPANVAGKIGVVLRYEWDEGARVYNHKFSSTQVDLPKDLQTKFQTWVNKHIAPEDFHAEEFEHGDEYHVTVRYGLHTEDAAPVNDILSGYGPVKLLLGKLELFTSHPDYDVLIVHVDSPDLVRLNGVLAELPHTDTYPGYTPHATLAYLKKGAGDKWVGNMDFAGQSFEAGEVKFSSTNELTELIKLEGKKLNRRKQSYAAGFNPVEALNYLASKSVVVKGIIDDELTKRVRLILLNYLKGGDLLKDVQQQIATVFEPYIGDPEKIVPSGITQTPQDVMQAYRLENIVRTNTTDALMQGRLAVADAVEDYIVGYEFSAILDDRVTEICDLADGVIIRANDPRLPTLTPPMLYQCRSTLIFITTDDLPVKWSSDAHIDRIVRMRVESGFQ